MKRRLQIARALMHRPHVLMLEEPTVGLDPHAGRDIWAAIRRINASGGTVFLTTHYAADAENLCHRVGIIDRGLAIALDTPADLVSQVGSLSVALLNAEKLETHLFRNLEDAVEFVAGRRADLTVRHAR